jgi:DUF1365 family protein
VSTRPGASPDLVSAEAPPAWIYTGTIRHRRFRPVEHAFSYRLFELLLDVDRLDEVFEQTWLWSRERFNLASFRRADYLGDAAQPLGESVRDAIAELGAPRPDRHHRIWMLTHLRYFGYCFNPVTFYYAVAPDGTLSSVLGEITNTPWLERHRYLVHAGDDPELGRREGTVLRRSFGKDFHVSPFFGMEQRYDWRFTVPDSSLAVHMENFEGDEKVFDATLTMQARPWSRRSRLGALLRFPAMTGAVWLGIHWQALRLWRKRVPVQPHP